MMNDERLMNSAVHQIELLKEYTGDLILDIGGGGEGIIGRIYGNQVVAIDIRKDELEECDNDALKIVMNATEMGFLDASFDTVTSFYSLMYLSRTSQIKAISEIYRVLKPGGIFEIWDAVVPGYDGTLEDIYVAHLRIKLPNLDEPVHVAYGVLMDALGQDNKTIDEIARTAGFKFFDSDIRDGHFNLKFEK